jgi:hypothetical protein
VCVRTHVFVCVCVCVWSVVPQSILNENALGCRAGLSWGSVGQSERRDR